MVKNNRRLISENKMVGICLLAIAILITIFIPKPSVTLRFTIYSVYGISIALILLKSSKDANMTFKTGNLVLTVLGGAAIPVLLFFTDPIGKFKENNYRQSIGLTVFVHGKKGKMDMILRQKGYVILELGGDRQRKPISENGDAHFENLHVGDKIRLDIDFTEPYHALNKDTSYVVDESGKIYLEARLEGIDRITGLVLFEDKPLSEVIVRTVDLSDTTDNAGGFTIHIPESLQMKEYVVWFHKNGFKIKSAHAYPQTGDPLVIILEK